MLIWVIHSVLGNDETILNKCQTNSHTGPIPNPIPNHNDFFEWQPFAMVAQHHYAS